MIISLDHIGKRFKFHWIFRNVNLTINQGQVLTIKGPNGSGKSTLLKILAGFLSPSQGEVKYLLDDQPQSDVYRFVSYAAPYVDLVEAMTLREHLLFHQQFKTFKKALTVEEIIDTLDLRHAVDKPIKDYSSGMRQRVRLGLTILSDSDICILDEPSTNLDNQGFEWYSNLLQTFKMNSTIVIASNETRDFIGEDLSIDIRDYK